MKDNTNNNEVKFNFPVGFFQFNKNKAFNFQLNRFYSYGLGNLEDLKDIGSKIKTVEDWKNLFLTYAKDRENKGDILHSAYYYRAADFYMPPFDQETMDVYDKFQYLINSVLKNDGVEIIHVPYEDSYLPCLRLKTDQENKRGNLVIHGGFDSYKEELYPLIKYFAKRGYDVVVFEGPGQGEANRKLNMPMNHHWEKPTSAVLDYFDLNDATLLGISMGGYLCFRAAAFDDRIKRVIASSVAYDYTDFPPKILQPIVYLFYNVFKKFTAKSILKVIDKKDINSWYFAHLQYMLKSDDPIEMVNFLTTMTAEELHCENIKQDVLILTGRDDKLCPFKMHKKQIKALINAKSVTGKVFYKDSNASNHCQIGNIGLSLDVMADWMDSKES